jgi:hypothetical protein
MPDENKKSRWDLIGESIAKEYQELKTALIISLEGLIYTFLVILEQILERRKS